MPFYENVFIARQDISATQVEALADGFTTLVTEQGGQVTKREYERELGNRFVDGLPRNLAGKVLKTELREAYG